MFQIETVVTVNHFNLLKFTPIIAIEPIAIFNQKKLFIFDEWYLQGRVHYRLLPDFSDFLIMSEHDDFEFEIKCGLLGSEAERRVAGNSFYNRYKKNLFAYLKSKFKSLDSHIIADITHDSFIQLWEKTQNQKEFDFDGALLPLLITIAKRRAIDFIRSSNRKLISDEEFRASVGYSLKGTQVGESWKQLVDELTAKEVRKEFDKFIPTLSAKQKIIADIYFSNFPHLLTPNEIQEEYFVRTNETITSIQIYSRLQVVRKKFRELLDNKKMKEL